MELHRTKTTNTDKPNGEGTPLEPNWRAIHSIAIVDIKHEPDMKSKDYFSSPIQFSASKVNKVAGMEESGILKKGMIDNLSSSIPEADYLYLGNATHELLEHHGRMKDTNIVLISSMPTKQELAVLTSYKDIDDFNEFVKAYISVYNNVDTRLAINIVNEEMTFDKELLKSWKKAYSNCQRSVTKMMDRYSDFLQVISNDKIPCTQTFIDITSKAWENVSNDPEIYDWYFPCQGKVSELPLWMNADKILNSEKLLEEVLGTDINAENKNATTSIPQEGLTEWMEFPEMKFTYKIQLLEGRYDTNSDMNDPEVRKVVENSFKPFAMFEGKGMMDKVCVRIDYSNKVLYYRLGDYKSTSTYLDDFVTSKYKGIRDYWRQIGFYNRLLTEFFWQYLREDVGSDGESQWDIQPDVRILAIQTNEWANLKDIKIGMGDLRFSQTGGFINPITSFDRTARYTDIFMQKDNPFYGYKELYKKGINEVIMVYWDNMSDELQEALKVDENGNWLYLEDTTDGGSADSENLDFNADEFV